MEPGSVSGLQQETLADETVFHLSLDFGPGNILDLEAIGQISEVLNEVRRLEGLKALVLDHTGDHFSFGASVEDHLPDRVGEMLPRFHALALSFLGLDLPILAVVRGLCLGGGLEVALLADRIFSSPTAHFGQPEIKLAVFAPLASALLPVRIGSRQATDLLLSGRKIDADNAYDLGLIDEIADDPFAAAMDWVAQNLASSSSAALRLATRAARSNWAVGLEATLDRLERLYLDELMATADATEGIQAFLERREPRFSNR